LASPSGPKTNRRGCDERRRGPPARSRGGEAHGVTVGSSGMGGIIFRGFVLFFGFFFGEPLRHDCPHSVFLPLFLLSQDFTGVAAGCSRRCPACEQSLLHHKEENGGGFFCCFDFFQCPPPPPKSRNERLRCGEESSPQAFLPPNSLSPSLKPTSVFIVAPWHLISANYGQLPD